MPKRTRSYEETLTRALRDPEEAAAYLNAHLEEADEAREEAFLLALSDVARAHGMDTEAAAIAAAEPPGARSPRRSSTQLGAIATILRVMGLRLAIQVQQKQAS